MRDAPVVAVLVDEALARAFTKMPLTSDPGGYHGSVVNPSFMLIAAAPTLSPRRMPEPSSTVPIGNCERSSQAAWRLTMSRFITKPPAQSTTPAAARA